MADPKVVGGVAVDDEGVSFVTATVDDKPGVIARDPQIRFCPRPPSGYSTEFLNAEIPRLVEQNSLELSAVGISMFGLIRQDEQHDANPAARCDRLEEVPRPDWNRDSVLPLVFKEIVPAWAEIPVFVQNDSTAWALTEYTQLAKPEECPSFVFVRVGSGVGAGALWRGQPRPGSVHPEAGHMPIAKRKGDLLEVSTCRAHTDHDCLERLISEEAILRRCPDAKSLDEISDGNPVWDLVADYLTQLCATLTMVLAPDRIVVAGRTMRKGSQVRESLYDELRERFALVVGGYPRYVKSGILPNFIQKGKVWEDGSLRGAIELARQGIMSPKER
ncbi:MAG: ROK family protein [Rhizomicrobium sp.]